MNYKCTNTGYFKDDGTHSRFFMSDTTDTMQKRNGACTTKYDLTSGKGHKCHGDSELEMRAISTDSAPSTTTGTCDNWTIRTTAPSCIY